MSASTWNRKQAILTIGIAALVSIIIVQAYALAIIMPRMGTVNGATTVTNSQNTITVLGTGHSSVQPDTAIVTVGVLTQATTVQAAVQANANTMNAVISGLNIVGVDSSSIQTTYYSVYPVYTGSSPPTITSYSVSNQIQITILSSGQTVNQLGTRAGQLIDTAVSNGANQLNGVQFTASQAVFQQAQQSALQNAGKDASNRAHAIASTMGVTITGLVSVSLPNTYSPPIFNAGFSAAGTPIVAPSSLTVTESIQAVYGIA